MTEIQREHARVRSAFSCGYCGVHEDDAGATLTIDHHRPLSSGGGNEDENLVYCCPRCNQHKGQYWHETNPPHIRLLHPSRDELTSHMQADEHGQLFGLTPTGEFFISRLRLNRPQLVTYRLNQRMAQTLRAELEDERQRVNKLRDQIWRLNAELEATERLIEAEGG